MPRHKFRLLTLVLIIAAALAGISSQLGFYIETSLFNGETHFFAVTGAITIISFMLSAPELIIIVGKNTINQINLAIIMSSLTALVLLMIYNSFNKSRELRENSCSEHNFFSNQFKKINIKQENKND